MNTVYHIDEYNKNAEQDMKILNQHISQQLSNIKSKRLVILLHSHLCGHCNDMKDKWNNFEQIIENRIKLTNKQPDTLVFKVENNYVNGLHPSVLKTLIGYPSIVGLSNSNILQYEYKQYPRETEYFLKFYDEINNTKSEYNIIKNKNNRVDNKQNTKLNSKVRVKKKSKKTKIRKSRNVKTKKKSKSRSRTRTRTNKR